MKIHAIQDAETATTTLDLKKFTDELRELSERYNVKLLSVGAFSSADETSPAYMAIWANEPNEN